MDDTFQNFESKNNETTSGEFAHEFPREFAGASEENQIPSLEAQLADMKDHWMRAVAESENIRKRAQRDKEDALKYGATSLARDLVSVADNLRRAVNIIQKENVDSADALAKLPPAFQSMFTGVEMIVKEMDTLFDRHAIKRLHPLNESFNANYHQAMFEVESPDHEAGIVLQVMQDGYTLHDRLLRPAMVGVSKKVQKLEDHHINPDIANSSEVA